MGKFFLSLKELSVCTKQFKLSEQLPHKGQLVKINLTNKAAKPDQVLETLQTQLIKENKNSLFIWTTPTTRLQADYDDCIYPGHNFSSVSDAQGEIACFMSKRPDTGSIIGERKRVPDARFKNQSGTTRLFSPRFSSVEEEVDQWFKRAFVCDDYPLFVHIIPLQAELELDIDSYKRNVDFLQGLGVPYTLFSFIHPNGDRYIPAANCNTATEHAIFGSSSTSVHDSSCQEAAIKIVTRLLKLKTDYLHTATFLGLTKGIEPSTIPEDLYRSSFTC